MKSEWRIVALGEIVNDYDALRIPLSTLQRQGRKGGYPYYGAQGVIDGVDGYIFDGTYLLIAEDGENLKSMKNDVARLAVGKFWVNNHAHVLENNEKCDIRFLCYLLNSIDLAPYITGSAQPKLNKKNLFSIELSIPSLATQRKIAAALSSLDDKIETNRAVCRNLEEQVLAIYDELVERVPLTVRKMEEVFDVFIGKTPPRNKREWFTSPPDGVTWVSIADMGRGAMFMRESSENLTADAVEKFHVKIVPAGAVMLSFKLTVGRVAIAAKELVTNEAIAHFVASGNVWMEYLYCYLRRFNYESLGNTSSIATAVNSKTIKAMPLMFPAQKDIRSFHSQVAAHFALIKEKLEENSRLAALRDTLLPRLMSGEIDVDKVQL